MAQAAPTTAQPIISPELGAFEQAEASPAAETEVDEPPAGSTPEDSGAGAPGEFGVADEVGAPEAVAGAPETFAAGDTAEVAETGTEPETPVTSEALGGYEASAAPEAPEAFESAGGPESAGAFESAEVPEAPGMPEVPGTSVAPGPAETEEGPAAAAGGRTGTTDDELTGVAEIRQAEGTQSERHETAPGDHARPEGNPIPPAPPTVAQPIVTPELAASMMPVAPTMAQPIVTPDEAAGMMPVAPTVAQPILTPAEATALEPVDVTVTDLPVTHVPVTYYGPGRRPSTEGRPGAAPDAGSDRAEAAQAAEPQGPKTMAHATYKRPELVSAADTVMLPKLKPPLKPSPKIARASTMVESTASQTGTSAGTAEGVASPPRPEKLIDQEQTTIFPAQTPALKIADPSRPEQPYRPSQRRKWISRAVLLAILMMQAVLSLRLHNAAFEDEAQYLYAGRLEILHLFHHQPLPINFASYFSGSPVLYPVAGAWMDSFGGLATARALSLAEMLTTTGLLYTISRRLFNERAAICAALLFSVTMSVTFLGNFATYDASCLFLLAVAAWIMVRTALLRWPVFVLAIPVAALAVAVKYAGALFLPTIAVLPVLTAWPYHRRRVWAYPVVFGVGVAALLYLGLKWGGHSYTQALSSTTTSRAKGTTPIGHIAWESLKWGGLQFFAAVFGTVAYAWRPRTDLEEEIAPAGSRLRRILLGLVLTGTALLAPLYQAHLHTDVSFLKHIGFGLFFAAPIAGVGLARVMGDHFRRPQLGIAVWGLALLLGMTEATHLYGDWGNETAFVKAFSKELKPGAMYLVEIPEVPIYYLEGNKEAQAAQFSSTFVLVYQNPKGVVLSGTTAYEAAIQNNYFQVVAYEGFTTPAVDNAIASELQKNKDYTKVKVVSDSTTYHNGAFTIWVRKAGVKGAGKLIG
jgi:hypothetical protein